MTQEFTTKTIGKTEPIRSIELEIDEKHNRKTLNELTMEEKGRLYQKLAEFSGFGASLPISSFGASLTVSALEEAEKVSEEGMTFLGSITGKNTLQLERIRNVKF